jgi:hypothetical protein
MTYKMPYPDPAPELKKTPEIAVSTYRSGAPKAAESFGGRGAMSLDDEQKATEARREQTVRPGGKYER